MNEYLTREIWKMRKSIAKQKNVPVVALLPISKKEYQLLFASCGCEKACTFCNYGYDYNLTLEMCKPHLEKIKLEDYDIEEVELEANGSFLSEREIPYDLFIEALKFVAHKNIPTISIETHYETVTEAKIQDIRRILGDNQEIYFELGFESASEDVRAIYNKDIDIEKYLKVVALCEKYNINLLINVLLGAPFLSREEQIQDCLDSIKFVFDNMPQTTRVILFPINIKKNTMLKHWQDIGVYDQISSWEFVELLNRIPEKYIGRISIAWWGTRENAYTPGIIQHPKTCSKCHDRLMKFYSELKESRDNNYKKRIIDKMWASRCECDK